MQFINKSIRKICSCFYAWRFRIRHRLMGGTINVDSGSILNASFGNGFILRGLISLSDSHLSIGDSCALAKNAELGVAKKGIIELSDKVSIGPRCIVSTSGGKVTIGSRTSFFSDCIISGMVDIGADCLFANNVTVLSGTHQIRGAGTIRENDTELERSPNYHPFNPIFIGNDCWLGANSVILPGVSLSKGTVVGANAVVTKNFPEYSILAGVPAVIIGSRK